MTTAIATTAEQTQGQSGWFDFMVTMSDFFTTFFPTNATTELRFTTSLPTDGDIIPAKVIEFGRKTAVDLLHDHQGYVRLNPIVTDIQPLDQTDEEWHDLDPAKILEDFDKLHPGQSVEPPGTFQVGPGNALDWKHYIITDQLPHPMGLPGTTKLVYQVAFRDTDQGFDSLVLAAGGVTIHGSYRVVKRIRESDRINGNEINEHPAGAEEKLWLQESAEIKCWKGTGWYIKKTLNDSHGDAHERFRVAWEEETRRRLQRGEKETMG